jgi:hypothetical protein
MTADRLHAQEDAVANALGVNQPLTQVTLSENACLQNSSTADSLVGIRVEETLEPSSNATSGNVMWHGKCETQPAVSTTKEPPSIGTSALFMKQGTSEFPGSADTTCSTADVLAWGRLDWSSDSTLRNHAIYAILDKQADLQCTRDDRAGMRLQVNMERPPEQCVNGNTQVSKPGCTQQDNTIAPQDSSPKISTSLQHGIPNQAGGPPHDRPFISVIPQHGSLMNSTGPQCWGPTISTGTQQDAIASLPNALNAKQFAVACGVQKSVKPIRTDYSLQAQDMPKAFETTASTGAIRSCSTGDSGCIKEAVVRSRQPSLVSSIARTVNSPKKEATTEVDWALAADIGAAVLAGASFGALVDHCLPAQQCRGKVPEASILNGHNFDSSLLVQRASADLPPRTTISSAETTAATPKAVAPTSKHPVPVPNHLATTESASQLGACLATGVHDSSCGSPDTKHDVLETQNQVDKDYNLNLHDCLGWAARPSKARTGDSVHCESIAMVIASKCNAHQHQECAGKEDVGVHAMQGTQQGTKPVEGDTGENMPGITPHAERTQCNEAHVAESTTCISAVDALQARQTTADVGESTGCVDVYNAVQAQQTQALMGESAEFADGSDTNHYQVASSTSAQGVPTTEVSSRPCNQTAEAFVSEGSRCIFRGNMATYKSEASIDLIHAAS